MNSEKYVCDFCGVEIDWEETDDFCGNVWICESCGRTFCSKCLQDAIGQDDYWGMMLSCVPALCPDCYKKANPKSWAMQSRAMVYTS